MSQFKHHTYFKTEKDIQSYLFPHVCFSCRKSFKKPNTNKTRLCPDCGVEMVQLSRKFKAPKKEDVSSWEVVKLVVNAGFRYQSINIEEGPQAKYPKSLKEAEEFILLHKNRAK